MDINQLLNQISTTSFDPKIAVKAFGEWVRSKANIVDELINDITSNGTLNTHVFQRGKVLINLDGLQKALHQGNDEFRSTDLHDHFDVSDADGLLAFLNDYSAAIQGDAYDDVEVAYNTLFPDLDPYDPLMDSNERYRRMAGEMGIDGAFTKTLNEIDVAIKQQYWTKDIRNNIIGGMINNTKQAISATYASELLRDTAQEVTISATVVESMDTMTNVLADNITFISAKLSTRFDSLTGNAKGLLNKYLNIINSENSIINKLKAIIFNFTPDTVDPLTGILHGYTDFYDSQGLGEGMRAFYFKNSPGYTFVQVLANPSSLFYNVKEVAEKTWNGVKNAFNTIFPNIVATGKRIKTAVEPSDVLYIQNNEVFEDLSIEKGYYHWIQNAALVPNIAARLDDHPKQILTFPAFGFTLYVYKQENSSDVHFFLKPHVYDYSCCVRLYQYIRDAAYSGDFNNFSQFLAQLTYDNLQVMISGVSDLPYAYKSIVSSGWILPICIKLFTKSNYSSIYNVVTQAGSGYDNTFSQYSASSAIPSTINSSLMLFQEYVYKANDSRADSLFSEIEDYLEDWFNYDIVNQGGIVPYFWSVSFLKPFYYILNNWDVINSVYDSQTLLTTGALLAGAIVITSALYISLKRAAFSVSRQADILAFNDGIPDSIAMRAAIKSRILNILLAVNPFTAISWAVSKIKTSTSNLLSRNDDNTNDILTRIDDGFDIETDDLLDAINLVSDKIGSIE